MTVPATHVNLVCARMASTATTVSASLASLVRTFFDLVQPQSRKHELLA